MNTRNLKITLNAGTDFSVTLYFADSNGPKDMTGYEFLSQMRGSSSSTPVDPVAEFDFTIPDQSTNKGQVIWSLSEEASEAIITSIATPLVDQRETTPFLFDVKMKAPAPSGAISRILQGIIEVSPEVTQEEFS